MQIVMARKSTYLGLRNLFSLFVALASFTLSFAQTDIIRPAVISVSPGNWSISINAGTTVTATFSEAMTASSISGATFELRNALNGALVPATVTYNAATRTATLYPTTPLTSFLYMAKVRGGSTGVKDLSANYMLSDYSWYFFMIPLYDLTPPTVLSVSPANGATGISVNADVTALLSEEMLPSSINTSTVELRNASGILIPAAVSYNIYTRVIKLDPTSALANSATYRATIKGGYYGVRDEAGNPLPSNYTWTFTTAAVTDIVPPTVRSVSPLNLTTGVSTTASVSATFSEPMTSSTINTSTFELRNPSTIVIPGSVSYNSTTRTASLTPSTALDPSTIYTAIVKGSFSGVKDVSGIPMTNNYTWSITTAAGIFGPGDVPQF